MNIPLERLIDGIIATMRSDVIPHVGDSYARGQAVGVIDLLTNIAPRIEWSRAPLARSLDAKRALLGEVARLVPEAAAIALPGGDGETSAELLDRRNALDAALGDAIALAWSRREEPGCARAIELIRTHLRDEMQAEMKITRKPLFAEIASGGDGTKA